MLFSDTIEQLSALFPAEVYNLSLWSTFENVVVCDGKQPIQHIPETAYVGMYFSSLMDLPALTPIILFGNVPNCFLETHQVLLIRDTSAYEKTIHLVKQWCYDEMQAEISAARKIFSLAASGCSLKRFTDEMAAILRNPVVVQGAAFELLSYCEYGAIDYIMFTEHIVNNHFSDSFIAESYRYNADMSSYKADHPNGIHIDRCPDTNIFTLTKALSQDAQSFSPGGRCLMMPEAVTPVNGMHFRLLPIIAEAINVVFRQTLRLFPKCACNEEELFLNLLCASDAHAAADLIQRINNMKDVHFPNKMCVIILTSEKERSNILGNSRILEFLRYKLKKIFFVPLDTHIVALYPLRPDQGSIDIQKDEGFLEVLQDESLIANISNEFESIDDIRTSYNSVLSAIESAKLMDYPFGRLFYAHSFSYFDFLKDRDKDSLRLCYHPALKILKDYDAENNTDLYNTLFMHLCLRGNANAVASRLHCHKNTVIYRIKKIEELTDVNFGDVWSTVSLLHSFFIDKLHPSI